MANLDESQRRARKVRRNGGSAASHLQLQLAAMVVDKIIERRAGQAAADVFWDDDSFDTIEEREFDPDLDSPNLEEETVPEMAEINHNIFECD
jgi:hypothetical protein